MDEEEWIQYLEEKKQMKKIKQKKILKKVALGAGAVAVGALVVGAAVVTGGLSIVAKAGIIAGASAIAHKVKKRRRKKALKNTQ